MININILFYYKQVSQRSQVMKWGLNNNMNMYKQFVTIISDVFIVIMITHTSHRSLTTDPCVSPSQLLLQLLVCDQSPQLPLRHAVAVLGVTLGRALAPRAVQSSSSLPEEWETSRAWLRLRWQIKSQIRTRSIIWSENIKLLKHKSLSEMIFINCFYSH